MTGLCECHKTTLAMYSELILGSSAQGGYHSNPLVRSKLLLNNTHTSNMVIAEVSDDRIMVTPSLAASKAKANSVIPPVLNNPAKMTAGIAQDAGVFLLQSDKI